MHDQKRPLALHLGKAKERLQLQMNWQHGRLEKPGDCSQHKHTILQERSEGGPDIRSVNITPISRACCCIESINSIMETSGNGSPVWLACFDVIRSEATNEML
jgi:hypothetical protein